MKFFKAAAGVVGLLVAMTSAAPLERRAVIAHDAVVGFPETVPSGNLGRIYLKYKPYLKVVNGCVPYPAVDAEGNTSGGLSPSGSPEGKCSSSTGQVYARAEAYNGAYAIMYSWYMPKDSPSSGIGHRHDWEGIVVWIDDPNKDEPTILGAAASGHGKFDAETDPPLQGTNPLIRYYSTWPIDHQLGFTSDVGGQQPLIAWESLTDAARDALQNTDFGAANVPFKDSNFESNLVKAEL
ncbi:necrosis and ethylene-inducing protein 2 precursor [Epithele typhae]|uniref:necrosis and ethylene-inducing protein 2 precursor n=1 Tax=Epithele typhae TaxID=378194 RepID=UPI002008A4D6|nr:necrosis and ethylene-inducing protein 2 precursor [Epithele typhae]KAH9912777.1 necrosis and ethylene-inducing protein 2 precursor [Epithele typhae]